MTALEQAPKPAGTCRVVDRSGATHCDLDRDVLERLRAGGFFWLDLHRPEPEQLTLLGDVFGFHELALEDSLNFGQRPKLDEYDDFDFLVLYGHAPDEDLLVEVHVYITEGFVVTVRRDEAPALDELHDSYKRRELHEDSAELLYRIAEGLVDSFFPALGELEDRLDEIGDALVEAPREEQLRTVFEIRRRLSVLRRFLGPQRDLLGRLGSGTSRVAGMTHEDEHYFRDVHDHALRLAELIEASRDLMNSAVDVYLSASSNRLNEVMKQLTVIATIFLPLTFITGFFGQNFGWLVDHVGGVSAFVVLGIGTQLVGALALFAYFRRRGWF